MASSNQFQQKMLGQSADQSLFEQAKTYACDYVEHISERNVYPIPEALDKLAVFDEPLPAEPGDPHEMLRLLHEYGSPATVAHTGGRYFGFVTGSVFTPVLAAKWLADAWDQLSALYVTSPITATLEAVCEKWLIDVLQLPQGSAAGFVSGTSMATLCGLAAARHELLKRQGWDVSSQGLFGAPPIRVVVGAEAHATVFKALALLGLGKDRVELVAVDEQGRMLAEKIPALDAHTLVIIQAGNVNSGAFDPIDEICTLAQAAGAWVHIDGAFGLWAAASSAKKHLVKGLEKADSWSVDGHKTLNTPYDSGIVICKQPDALISALQASGSYIIYSDKRDGMLYAPEMSRRSRGIELWATLKIIGRSGVEALIDGLCLHAEQIATQLKAEGFNILNDVVFNQVLVACDSDEETAAVTKHLQQSGECWCGGAKWHGKQVIRVSVCSWVTTEADITRSVAAFVEARRQAKA